MRKKGALIAVVAGLFGLIVAVTSVVVLGEIGPAARISDSAFWRGWGGVLSSLFTIVLGAICIFTTTTRPARLLALNALVGVVIGLTPVAIFMAVAFFGASLATLGGASKPSIHRSA